jgi:asparagine synthase (glutamine-hydrolysing)
MCGIAGGTKVHPQAMEAALASIHHRGPDSQGAWTSPRGDVTLGFVRLAIIDLNAAANQPMKCARTGNMITFNGEIYNYRAIKSELIGVGWEFRTKSDTEVLLAAYAEWGPDCLSRVNGMFGFVLFDVQANRLFIGRDRVGKKPVYYSTSGRELTWASEIKALLALRPDLPRSIDEDALNEYMHLGYIPGELSIYSHIRKLPAAHFAIYDLATREFKMQRYWSLPAPSTVEIDEVEAAERLEDLLMDAVRIRLESDVPIGILLSGGLDSSLVAAMAARQNDSLVAYSAQFDHASYDETATAASVAKHIGISHTVVPVDSASGGHLACLGVQFDEPFADSSLLPTYLVSRAIREHVTVALTGDGGDELFGGYDLYRQVLHEQKWERIPRAARSLLGPAHHLLPVGKPGKNFLRRLPAQGAGRYRAVTSLPEDTGGSPLTATLAARLGRLTSDAKRSALEAALDRMQPRAAMTLLQKMTRLDFDSWLVDDVLVKVDRASMLTSIEVRSPLLDYRIAELAYSLPDRLRCDGVTRKVLLKRIARKYLPPDFPYERKMGFNIPETEWFAADWRVLLQELLCNGSQLLDCKRVAAIQDEHLKSRRYGRELFKIMMLAQFEQNYGGTLD